jgi:hypothetical protein
LLPVSVTVVPSLFPSARVKVGAAIASVAALAVLIHRRLPSIMVDTPRLLWPAARGGSYHPVSVAEREKLG